MNLIIPIASSSKFFNLEDYGYPKPLVEVMGKPMIQYVIENITQGIQFKKITFVVKQDDCHKYHLDNILNLLSPIKPVIVKLRADTQGALCSVLLAVEHISHDEPLVISNADQTFDGGISNQYEKFISEGADAACITFNSIHPRWSYVRVDENDSVVEAAEKRPISKHAIAGIYMYKNGADFIEYSMKSIKNNSIVDGNYFISPVFNEFILAGKKVMHYSISNSSYHSFYSPQKIEEYESQFGRGI